MVKKYLNQAMIVRLFFLLQTFLAFTNFLEVAGSNHQCYVCVPNTGSSISDVVKLFPDTIIPSCNRFGVDNPEFKKECPSSSYQGCMTQTNGTHVTKTCTKVGIEDCKTANKIRYCYCKGMLCNKEDVPPEASLPPEVSADDDEDSLPEGSGSPEGEASSEGDLAPEIVRKLLPTTTESATLTTRRPEGVQPANASANPSARPKHAFWAVSFLLLLSLIEWN